MTQPNTFGFEAEFQTNVEALIGGLTSRGRDLGIPLAGQHHMHNYHCDCDDICDFGSGYIFRAQTDSSCGGEVISHIFNSGDMSEAIEAMHALQEVAVEVDAEPSLNAGFHVHVGKPTSWRDRHNGFAAFLRYEDVLTNLAAGRFCHMREFNYSLRGALYGAVSVYDLADTTGIAVDVLTNNLYSGCFNVDYLLALNASTRGEVIAQFYERAFHMDRHSNLAINTASGVTWEYRLWNSTRSAWRMEMFCRLSLLMADHEAQRLLLDLDYDASEDRLMEVADVVDPNLPPLLERQQMTARTDDPFTVLLAS